VSSKTGSTRASRSRPCSSRSDSDEDLPKRFTLEVRNHAPGRRIADRDQDVGSLVLWPSENLTQKAHRARRVSQRREACPVEACEEQADGDPDGLLATVRLARIRSRKVRDRASCSVSGSLANRRGTKRGSSLIAQEFRTRGSLPFAARPIRLAA
jgi:hypothetical protein